jgi:hypothetical protein
MVPRHGSSGEPTGLGCAASAQRRLPSAPPSAAIRSARPWRRGKISMGWFDGLKQRFVIHHQGQVTAMNATPGTTADRTRLNARARPPRGQASGGHGR